MYFLNGEEPYLSRVLVPLFARVQAGEASVIASAITEAELLVRPERAGDQGAIQRIGDLLSEPGIEVVDVTRRMARLAARLRARNSLKLPDAIIVSTAIETRCQAIVGNDHDWAKQPVDVTYILLDDLVRV
jgi:predicted nucleic acid-binding protein